MTNISDNKYSSKSCYRLYAGHGNWINLNQKTTQDLLQIFRDGVPCRYPLSEGLAIDIIPNDVDCNSKNIDVFGLMRADLVYESQADENHVQQLMSHYIRSLLDEQGIIDAFPPLRTGEDLPIVTSIPTHRHLSMVPSVVGAVRRGPKPNSYKKTNNNSSSSSTSQGPDHSLVSSSISSSSSSSPSRSRKKPSYSILTRRATATNNNPKKLRDMDHVNTMMPTEMNYVQLYDQNTHQPHYLDMNPSPTTSSHTEYHEQQQQNHHYGVNPMLPMAFGQHHHHGEEESNIWMPFQHHHQQQNSSATRSTAAFNFDFPMTGFERTTEDEVVERQSPTDILTEYEFTQQQQQQHRGFDGDLYSTTTNSILEDNHHLPPSSDSTDSYVPPTSPWAQQQQHYNNQRPNSTTESMDESPNNREEGHHLFHKVTKELMGNHIVTTLPMDRILLASSSDKSNNNNATGSLVLSHGDNESS